MAIMTRRQFLVGSGVTAGAALAAGATTTSWFQLLRAAEDDPLPTDASVLVLVTLYGGNDGLNTVIPASDPAYHDLRTELAYAEDEVLPLGEGLGLNPEMTGLAQTWQQGRLAIVRGVSYPTPDRSHFRSMAIWQTASPETSVPSGWLGRWLDATGDDPLRAISIGATLPPLLAGTRTAGSALPLQGMQLPDGPWRSSLTALGSETAGEHPYLARAASSLGDLVTLDDTFSGVNTGTEGADEADDALPTDGASAGGQGQLAAQLDVVASAIAAGVPTRVYSVSLGGFDTHSNEKVTQSRILAELDRAVTGFLAKIRGTDAGNRVVVAIYSEFGRRVPANANQGTDHGTSGPLFVLGDPVRGGFYGEQPDLTRLDGDDLAVTTDFRDVYATLLAHVLDTDPGPILGGHEREISFVG